MRIKKLADALAEAVKDVHCFNGTEASDADVSAITDHIVNQIGRVLESEGVISNAQGFASYVNDDVKKWKKTIK
jgi:hypothetical protein